jgi:hypothetical protein
LLDLPFVHDDDPIRDRERLFLVVRDVCQEPPGTKPVMCSKGKPVKSTPTKPPLRIADESKTNETGSIDCWDRHLLG